MVYNYFLKNRVDCKMNRQFNIIIFIIFSFITIINIEAENDLKLYNFKSFSNINNGPGNTIRSVIQDEKGFMWIGTSNGLFRYDSIKFRKFLYNSSDNTSISNNFIYSLSTASNNKMWVGTGTGLNIYNSNDDSFNLINLNNKNTTYIDNSLNTFSVLFKDKNNLIWFGINDFGIASFNQDTGKYTKYNLASILNDKPFHHLTIYGIIHGQNNTIWVATEKKGLMKVNLFNSKITRYLKPVNKNNINYTKKFYALVKDKFGRIFAGTSNGLYIYSKDLDKFVNYQKDILNELNSFYNIRSLFIDSDNILWIGTSNRGLCYMNLVETNKKMEIKFPRSPYNLNSMRIMCIYEDAEKNLWIGTSPNGLFMFSRYSSNIKQYLNSRADIGNNSKKIIVGSIKEDLQGNYIVGTYFNGLFRIDSLSGRTINYSKILSQSNSIGSNKLTSIFVDKQNRHWIGMGGAGLDKYNPKSNMFLHFKEKLFKSNDFFITTISSDNHGKLLIGTKNRGLFLFDPDSNKISNIKNVLQKAFNLPDTITSLHPDPYDKNIIWIGSFRKGLFKFNRKTKNIQSFLPEISKHNSISFWYITSIHTDRLKPEFLWIGTAMGGLKKFNKKKKEWIDYIKSKQLKKIGVYGILQDKIGNLWISTKNGILNYLPNSGEIINYFELNHIQNKEFNEGAYFSANNGLLLFGNVNGLISFNPLTIRKNKVIPKIAITQIIVFGKEHRIINTNFENSTINLKYNDTFSISFSSLSYVDGSYNKYAYKINGLDSKWKKINNSNTLTFKNIKLGNYEFHVKGSNNDGIWNEIGTSFKFTIHPPFWLSLWFKSLIFFILCSLCFYVFKIYINRIKKQIRYEEKINDICKRKKITDTEKQQLILILKGKSNKEIEDVLFISSGTIRNNNSQIYKKFNVKNRIDLIKMFRNKNTDKTGNA